MIPVCHQAYLASIPEYENNEQLFVSRLLAYGGSLPMPDLPDPQYLMPGQVINITATLDPSISHVPQMGPFGRTCRYMVVSVAPDYDDHSRRHHLNSPAGKIMADALRNAGFQDGEVYFTTVMRFAKPMNAGSYKATWIKPGWEYLKQEIDIIQPAAILFLGAEPAKLAFGKITLDAVRGQIEQFSTGQWSCRATACSSHHNFVSSTAGFGSFVKQLEFFRSIGLSDEAKALTGLSYPDRDYKVLWTLEEIVAEVTAELAAGHPMIAIDVETGSDDGRPDHEYCTTFQWSHGPGHARIIPLVVERPEPLVTMEVKGQIVEILRFGGSGVDRKSKEDRVPFWSEATVQIRRLVEGIRRLIGHNLRYDLKSLRDDLGIPIRQFCNAERSGDTMLMYHLLEKDEYGLKQLTLRYTDMGAYNAPMERWVTDNSGEGKLFPGNAEERYFFGYRDIAFKYLLPYAMCDVDATMRLYPILMARLQEKGNEPLLKLLNEIELPLQHALIDIETNGIPADPERLEYLSGLYQTQFQSLIEAVRAKTNWPEFNPNSTQQVQAVLFRPPFKEDEKILAKLPEGVVRLNLMPATTTGKFPKKWEEIPYDRRVWESPCTDADTIRSLLTANFDTLTNDQKDVIQLLIDIKDMRNFITNFLCEPKFDSPVGTAAPQYGKGLRGSIRDNGRISTRISTLSETGRWKHSEPNLANLPKTKEDNIKRIFGKDAKIPKVRSGFRAKPGWIFMEADYKSAELFCMGYLSGDKAFMEVLDSGVDVHGYNAKRIFGLDCTANEVAEKFPLLRFAVKAIAFGIAYGLGANGLADQLTLKFKRLVTSDEAQGLIDQFFGTYPVLKQFFDQSKHDCEHQGYVETAFGRRRYFPGVARLGRAKLAAAKREACNARIQGTVADVLNLASINLDNLRYETDVGREIAWEYMVAIHDAEFLHIPIWSIDTMAEILQYSMSDMIVIPGTGGRRLSIDVQVGERWGELEDLHKYKHKLSLQGTPH